MKKYFYFSKFTIVWLYMLSKGPASLIRWCILYVLEKPENYLIKWLNGSGEGIIFLNLSILQEKVAISWGNLEVRDSHIVYILINKFRVKKSLFFSNMSDLILIQKYILSWYLKWPRSDSSLTRQSDRSHDFSFP